MAHGQRSGWAAALADRAVLARLVSCGARSLPLYQLCNLVRRQMLGLPLGAVKMRSKALADPSVALEVFRAAARTHAIIPVEYDVGEFWIGASPASKLPAEALEIQLQSSLRTSLRIRSAAQPGDASVIFPWTRHVTSIMQDRILTTAMKSRWLLWILRENAARLQGCAQRQAAVEFFELADFTTDDGGAFAEEVAALLGAQHGPLTLKLLLVDAGTLRLLSDACLCARLRELHLFLPTWACTSAGMAAAVDQLATHATSLATLRIKELPGGGVLTLGMLRDLFTRRHLVEFDGIVGGGAGGEHGAALRALCSGQRLRKLALKWADGFEQLPVVAILGEQLRAGNLRLLTELTVLQRTAPGVGHLRQVSDNTLIGGGVPGSDASALVRVLPRSIRRFSLHSIGPDGFLDVEALLRRIGALPRLVRLELGTTERMPLRERNKRTQSFGRRVEAQFPALQTLVSMYPA